MTLFQRRRGFILVDVKSTNFPTLYLCAFKKKKGLTGHRSSKKEGILLTLLSVSNLHFLKIYFSRMH